MVHIGLIVTYAISVAITIPREMAAKSANGIQIRPLMTKGRDVIPEGNNRKCALTIFRFPPNTDYCRTKLFLTPYS